MTDTSHRLSNVISVVLLAQFVLFGDPSRRRSSVGIVDGSSLVTASGAVCECASCGATICRSACKHDCSQCCRCCIYFEIRVGRRRAAFSIDDDDDDVSSAFPAVVEAGGRDRKSNIVGGGDGRQMRKLLSRRRRQLLYEGGDDDKDGEEQLAATDWSGNNRSISSTMEDHSTAETVRRRADRGTGSGSSRPRTTSSSSSAPDRREPYFHALEALWNHPPPKGVRISAAVGNTTTMTVSPTAVSRSQKAAAADRMMSASLSSAAAFLADTRKTRSDEISNYDEFAGRLLLVNSTSTPLKSAADYVRDQCRPRGGQAGGRLLIQLLPTSSSSTVVCGNGVSDRLATHRL